MAKPTIPASLNICITANKFPIVGRAADHGFLWPIAKGLAQQGHNVTVLAALSPTGKSEIQQDGVKAYYLQTGKMYNPNRFPYQVKDKFAELNKIEPFHIVHSIDGSGYRIARYRKHYKTAVAYDVDATQMAQIFSIMGMSQESLGSLIKTGIAVGYKFLRTFYGEDRWILKTADGVFVTSPMQRLALERYYLYPDDKIFTVPYGMEVKPGDSVSFEGTKTLRESLNLLESTQTIVTVSDFAEIGELKNLLYAFQNITIKKPNTRLIIVGNGPTKNEVEFELLQLALGSRVILAGAVKNSELPDYISLADVYVNLSARTSGFEPAMLEAMAQEKVVIGSEVSPISTIIENGVDGFLLRPADTQSLANLILDIFTENLEKESIGAQGRKKVMNLFDTEKMVEQTMKAYIKILRRSSFYRK